MHGLFTLLVVVGAAAGWLSAARVSDARQVESQLVPAAFDVARLMISISDQQASVRGFGFTGNAELLGTYFDGRRVESESLGGLRAQFSGDPTLLVQVDQLGADLDGWRQQVAEPVIAASGDARPGTVSRLVAGVGEPLLRQVREDAATLSADLDRRLTSSRVALAGTIDNLQLILRVASVLALGGLVAGLVLLQSWITRPAQALNRQLRALVSGDSDQPLSVVGPDEFVSIAWNVNIMRRAQSMQRVQARRTWEAMAQRAPLVASLRVLLRPSARVLPAGVRIAGRYYPDDCILDGRFYEVIDLDETRVVLLAAEVSGQGGIPGLCALWLKSKLEPVCRMGLDPGEALNWVMAEARETPIAWSAVCLVIELDTVTGSLRYANAGHPPPLVVGDGGARLLAQTGPRIGQHAARCDTVDTVLGPDEVLVLHSGGVTGARNAAGEHFDSTRLASLLATAPGDQVDVESLADRAIEALREFSAHPEHDPVGLVVVSRVSVPDRAAASGAVAAGRHPSNGSTPPPLLRSPSDLGSPTPVLTNGGKHVFGTPDQR